MNVGKPQLGRMEASVPKALSMPEDMFDDLESWDDSEMPDDLGELASNSPDVSAGTAWVEADAVPPQEPTPGKIATDSKPAESLETPATAKEVKAAALQPRLGLSKVERLAMVVLVILLLLGGAFMYMFSLMRLPTQSAHAREVDFPVQGAQVTVQSAATYWRAPVTEGPDADTFRRGTVLLPEIDLKLGGSGAIRVLFRDEQRRLIGDAVTRTVSGSQQLRIPATAGFEELGMHAAYRTGASKPWTATVYEARSVSATGSDFKKLFEITISTERR